MDSTHSIEAAPSPGHWTGEDEMKIERTRRHSQQHVMDDTSENLNMQHNGKAINKSCSQLHNRGVF